MEKKENKQPSKYISRKDTVNKMKKYGALTALGTTIILNSQKAQAQFGPSKPRGC